MPQSGGIGLPSCLATSTLPSAMLVVAMSMMTGGPSPAGAPKASGLEPRKIFFIPVGTMIGSVWVMAMPIMPARAACSTNQAMAPQCELFLRADRAGAGFSCK